MKVALSLGTNLGNRLENLTQAIYLINNTVGEIIDTSNIYETEPWGFQCKNFFLNSAATLNTYLSPQNLLLELQKIEKILGRTHKTKDSYQARIIDIDIIFYGNKIIKSENLAIPHPHMHKRKFVLFPLNEIAPTWKHPVYNLAVKQLLEICPDNSEINLYKPKLSVT